jgi:hypothetical protein
MRAVIETHGSKASASHELPSILIQFCTKGTELGMKVTG